MSIQLIAVLLLIVLVAGWFYGKARRNSSASSRRAHLKFPGVVIEADYSVTSCAAVQRLSKQRFLAKDAPKLPLAGCDIEKCRCRYVRYKDRRDDEDRRSLYATGVGGMNIESRRHSKGRRATDVEEQSMG